jgi:hypothetical protein
LKTNLLTGLLTLTLSTVAFAGTQVPLDQRHDCQKASSDAVTQQFQSGTGYSDEEMDSLAVVEPDQPKNSLSVRVNSQNVVDWDGYADYLVSLQVTATSCKATKVVLTSSEGF